jgi:uncharacterized protein
MSSRREFRTFQFRQAVYRVHSDHFAAVSRCIRRMWNELEGYIALHPQFAESLSPLASPPGENSVGLCGSDSLAVNRMLRAAATAGVGPMAAVAGTFAQLAAEAGRQAGDKEIIVENGGDIYMYLERPLIMALWVGPDSPFKNLAFSIQAQHSPLAVCSSSSRLGHSLSLGECDLFTVFSKDASLADAAATAYCNRVKQFTDLQPAVEEIVQIPGIEGAAAVKDDKIAIAGKTPALVRHADVELSRKITRHSRSTEA